MSKTVGLKITHTFLELTAILSMLVVLIPRTAGDPTEVSLFTVCCVHALRDYNKVKCKVPFLSCVNKMQQTV